jgi:hypothetical protein
MEDLMREPDANEPGLDSALFQDSGIVPAQFYPHRRGAAETEPIRRLMIAMLVDAVQCFQAGERQTVKRKEVWDARTWIFGRYADFPFSFVNVCAELGVSPHRIRRQLLHIGVRPRRIHPAIGRRAPLRGAERRRRFISVRQIDSRALGD